MSRQFTEDEAREILALAAERSHTARSEAASRLTLSELEEAARAAGIDPAHVQSAAADVLSPGRRAVHRTFLGVPVEVRRTRTVSPHLGPDEWAVTVEECRREFGKRGVVTDLGRTREWSSHPDERQAPVRVIAEPTEGGTRVTAERNTWPRALGVTLGAGSNLAVALVMGAVWLASGAESILWAPALLIAVFAVAFAVVGLSKLRKKGHEEAEAFDRILGSTADHEGAHESQVDTAETTELRGGILGDAFTNETDISELNDVNRASRTRV